LVRGRKIQQHETAVARPSEERIRALKNAIRDVPDFPRPGIVFKDLTTLFREAESLRLAVDLLVDLSSDLEPQKVVAIESRGFILGGALADRLNVGFVPARKPGKLPYRTLSCSYELEYGEDRLEIHEDALAAGERAIVVDDLIATGGTAAAAGELVRRLGGQVAGYVFLVELSFLRGRERLGEHEVRSLLVY
jgi:adenine phosphoribosyltransferase